MHRNRFPTLVAPSRSFDLQHKLKRVQSRNKAGFESLDDVESEDRLRARVLRKHCPHKVGVRIRVSRASNTLASARCVREFRRGYIGQVLALLDREEDTWLYTIIPEGWIVAGDDLAAVHPKRLLEAFRAQVYRLGVGRLAGWMVVFLHGEYVSSTDTYQPHLHIVGSGQKCLALEEWGRKQGSTSAVRYPKRRQRLKDFPRQVSYFGWQGYWPMKRVAHGAKVGKGRRRRLPAHRLAEWLVWIDQFSASDFLWLHGCTFRRGGIVRV